tara:strand:- start:723 stop:1070 length:348 start_codon:yes stop_codon:yes gene_type:complete
MTEIKTLSVLVAPLGQLSGDGQLLESFTERRERKGSDYPMWYLTPELVEKFELPATNGDEAVIAEDASSIAWLNLRFGGKKSTLEIDVDELKQYANNLPPAPERRDIGIKRKKKT